MHLGQFLRTDTNPNVHQDIWRKYSNSCSTLPRRQASKLSKMQVTILWCANLPLQVWRTAKASSCRHIWIWFHRNHLRANTIFETDPIETYIDGDWVKAKGTTLGSDDGLGVACIMAVMEAKDLKHGPVEAVITADEETGMYGANDLPENELIGDILLNLDSEKWGKFVIGSAGGIDFTAELDYKEVATDAEDAALKVTFERSAWRPLRTGNPTKDVPMPTSWWYVSCVMQSQNAMPTGYMARWQHAQCHSV